MNHQDIKATGKTFAETTFEHCEQMNAAYWKAHKELAETEFSSTHDQNEAVRKLSQLGLALHAARQAYSAINLVRCN